MDEQHGKLQVVYHGMSMHCLLATGQIVAGFLLLERAEAIGMFSCASLGHS